MNIRVVFKTENDNNKVYFYSRYKDDSTHEITGVYLINEFTSRFYLADNVHIEKYVKNEFSIFYNIANFNEISSISLKLHGNIIKLNEIKYLNDSVDYQIKLALDFLISRDKSKNSVIKRKINEIVPLDDNYYCGICSEDSMRFECDNTKCSNNSKYKNNKENKLKSYCDRCDEDSMRFSCDNKLCKNYCI